MSIETIENEVRERINKQKSQNSNSCSSYNYDMMARESDYRAEIIGLKCDWVRDMIFSQKLTDEEKLKEVSEMCFNSFSEFETLDYIDDLLRSFFDRLKKRV